MVAIWWCRRTIAVYTWQATGEWCSSPWLVAFVMPRIVLNALATPSVSGIGKKLLVRTSPKSAVSHFNEKQKFSNFLSGIIQSYFAFIVLYRIVEMATGSELSARCARWTAARLWRRDPLAERDGDAGFHRSPGLSHSKSDQQQRRRRRLDPQQSPALAQSS